VKGTALLDVPSFVKIKGRVQQILVFHSYIFTALVEEQHLKKEKSLFKKGGTRANLFQ